MIVHRTSLNIKKKKKKHGLGAQEFLLEIRRGLKVNIQGQAYIAY